MGKAMAVSRDQQVEYPPHGALVSGRADQHGVYHTEELGTQPNAPAVWATLSHGVTLYEPLGGLCAGLEAVLRSGIKVHRYIYSDISPSAQAVARHRISRLRERYPQQLTAEATARTFNTLHMDVAHHHY